MRSRSRNRKSVPFVASVIALLIVVVIGILFAGSLFRIVSAFVVSLSIEPTEEYELLPKNILASRLSDAERELIHVRYQATLYASLIEENQRLIDELGLRGVEEVGIGRVVNRPPHTHYDTMLVSLRDGHDVREGDTALFEGILLGEATKVSDSAALVSLYTSPGTTLDVRVGEPSAIVVAHGLGGGSFIFDVPNEVAVVEGDFVSSAAYDAQVIGVVRSITVDPDKTSKRVYAQTAASFSDIRFINFSRSIRFPELEQ